ncbi:MAG: PAS domain S-box protein [Elusimicrobiota bacterium]
MEVNSDLDLSKILKCAIDQTLVPYLITDINGIIIYANSSVTRTTGYSIDELIGKKTSIFKSGTHNEELYKKLWNTILKGNFFSSRMINKRKDGSLYQLRITIQPIKVDGEIKYFLSREEDITQIIELENKLIESQKLESVALMVGELAHDFNNFLTVIIGGLELIKDDIDKKLVHYQLADEILKSAKEQAKIIKQLLMFSRKHQPIYTEASLNQIITDMIPLIQSQVSSKITLNIQLSENIPKINIDEQLIKQAILNLTSNAKDAIDGVGEIIIKTYSKTTTSEYEEPYHEGEYSVIEIMDTGKGISEDAAKHLFEPFFTTKLKGKGTGLGLSSTYGIIKNHNGYIYASNRNDSRGASFRIYLPKK